MNKQLIALLWTLLLLCGQLSGAESGDGDHEAKLVRQGVLGVVNVLRELDPRAFTNRVTVTSNVEGLNGTTPQDTIDASGRFFHPRVAAAQPMVLTYLLPGPRIVSSLVISYQYGSLDAPGAVALERSIDGGQTWSRVFGGAVRKSDLIKVFAPVQANALRITQEGDGTEKCARKTKEVSVYADPETTRPAFVSPEGGLRNFLRGAWYAGEIKEFRSPDTAVWTPPFGGKSFPHVPFASGIADGHDGAWGGSDRNEVGRRVYLRMDFERARRMDFCVIGSVPGGAGNEYVLSATSGAEFYTGNGKLDPAGLASARSEALVAQGWVSQKSWEGDTNACKAFRLSHPGEYNQMLLVWDGLGLHPMPQNWGRLEMFGALVQPENRDRK